MDNDNRLTDASKSRPPTSKASAEPQDRYNHRLWIGGRIFTLLQQYWSTDDLPEVFEKLVKDWMDVLEPFPQEAIEHACVSYLQAQSRKPVPADIRNRAAAWVEQRKPKQVALPPPPPPPRKVVDAETAARIMHEAGFTPEKANLVRRFPNAPTYAAAEAMSHIPKRPHWTETADPDGPEMKALRAARDANPIIQAARAAQAAREAEQKEPKA